MLTIDGFFVFLVRRLGCDEARWRKVRRDPRIDLMISNFILMRVLLLDNETVSLWKKKNYKNIERK